MADMQVGVLGQETVAAAYQRMLMDRREFLDRARECSALTIPSLYPPEGFSSGDKLYKPFQAVGAYGVNNLASKLLTSLVPANEPFFQLRINELDAPGFEDADEEARAEIQKTFRTIERAAMVEVETNGDRVAIGEALLHLVVAGSVVLYRGDAAAPRIYSLERFVTCLDPKGDLVRLIIEDPYSYETLPESVKPLVDNPGEHRSKTFNIYTNVQRSTTSKFEVYQEVNGIEIPGTRKTYAEDNMPWLFLRMIRISGENYGRSYVSQYMGDLHSLEALSRAIVEGTAAGSKIIMTVNPNGSTRRADVRKARNGAIIAGREDDIGVIQPAKFMSFEFALTMAQRLEARLQQAFLMYASIQRDAERVTAEEIRTLAQDLEASLGGVYSLLSMEFQQPYANRLLAVLRRTTALKKLPKAVKPQVVTGLEALGRGNDLNKLTTFIQTLANTLGPEAVSRNISEPDFVNRLSNSLGIDPDGLVKDETQIAEDQTAVATAGVMQQAAPKMLEQAQAQGEIAE